MKIDSPSSITSREASIRLEWISTRILPGVAVLLLSIPLCQWADSILPDGIVPVYVIYMLSVTVLWSMYMAVQYAFAGIVQTRKDKTHACNNQTATNGSTAQTPILLLTAMPIVNEPNVTEDVCDTAVVEEIADEISVTDNKVISEEANPDNEPSTFRSLLPVRPVSRALMTFIRVRQKTKGGNWTPFMNTFYTSCLLLFMRKTWASSVQTC